MGERFPIYFPGYLYFFISKVTWVKYGRITSHTIPRFFYNLRHTANMGKMWEKDFPYNSQVTYSLLHQK